MLWLRNWIFIQLYTHNNVEINHIVSVAIYIFAQFQVLGMLVYPMVDAENSIIGTTLSVLLKIVRFDIWMMNNDWLMGSYTYLFIFMIIVLEKGITIFILIYSRLTKIQDQYQYMHKDQTRILQCLSYILGVYSQLKVTFLNIPFTTVIIYSMKLISKDIQTDLTQYINFAFASIVLLIFQVDIIWNYMIVEETITLRIQIFQKLNITSFELLAYLVQFVQIICYGLFTDITTAIEVQCVFIILISILYQHSESTHDLIQNQSLHFLFVFSRSLSLSICIIEFTMQFIKYFSFTQTLQIMISPLIYHIIHQYDDKRQSQFRFYQKRSHSKDLFQFFLRLINRVDISSNTKVIEYSFVQLAHRRGCKDVGCHCQNSKPALEVQSAFMISDTAFRTLLFKKIKQFRKQINVSQSDAMILIHYSAILLNFGWIIYSIKQLNSIIYFDKRAHKYLDASNSSTIVNDYKSSKTYREDGLSHQTMNTSSVSSQLAGIANSQLSKNGKITIQTKLQFSQLFRYKADYLLQYAKNQVNSTFSHTQVKTETISISQAIQKFLEIEIINKDILKKIKIIIQKKVSFYMDLFGDKILTNNLLFRKTKNITLMMTRLEQRILNLYHQFPSERLQSTLCFFQAEILNNWSQAQKYSKQTRLGDERLEQFQNSQGAILFDENVQYLLISVNDDLQSLSLDTKSSKFELIFGPCKDLNSIIPQFIAPEHPLLLSRFISTGQSKYYRNFNQSFIQSQSGFVDTVMMCFDNTQLFAQNKLTFATFIRALPQIEACLLIDVNKVLGGVTRSFYTKLGYEQEEIYELIKIHSQQVLNIEWLIPNFNNYITQYGDVIRLHSIELCYLDSLTIQNIGVYVDVTKQSSNQLEQLWQSDKNMKSYSANITIYKRYIMHFCYYIVVVDDIIQVREPSRSQSLAGQSFKQNVTISELEISLSEAEPQEPNRGEYQYRLIKKLANSAVKEVSQGFNKDSFNIQTPIAILSPNNSQSLLRNEKSEQFPMFQQEFFQNQDKIMKIDSKQDLSRTNKLKKSKDGLEGGSQQSSIAGMNKSIFYQKYMLFNQLLIQKHPLYLDLSISMLVLQLIIFISFTLIVLTAGSTDLNQFIQEIDMMTLQSGLMSPHDFFFAFRVCITMYQSFQTSAFINATQLTALTNPLYQYATLGYFELQSTFYSQQENANLQQFFTNESFVTYFQKSASLNTIYPLNLTLNAALYIEIEQQYKFMITFQRRGSTSGATFQVYQYANYHNFQNILEKLTLSISEYTKERSQNVINKWFTQWIIYLLTTIGFGFICFYYYNNYLSYYDQLLGLYKYLDQNSIMIEIEKNKQFMKLIDGDESYIFSYDFDFSKREANMKQKKMTVNQSKFKDKRSLGYYKLRRMSSLILIIATYSLFVLYSTIQNQSTQRFLNKYSSTTDIFTILQNCRFRSGNLYLYREILYRWSNFSYLTATNLNDNYLLIEKGLNASQQYLSVLPTIDAENYLISDSFFQFLKTIQTSDLCPYIDKTYFATLSSYCSSSFQGAIRQGMVQTLNFVYNSIRTEQAINNFTKRNDVSFYEIEGAQIISRVFTTLTSEFKQGMIEKTQTQNSINNGLSIGFLCIFIVYSILIIFMIQDMLRTEYIQLKRFIHLIPIEIILINDAFERSLRLIMLNQNI